MDIKTFYGTNYNNGRSRNAQRNTVKCIYILLDTQNVQKTPKWRNNSFFQTNVTLL